MKKQTYVLPFFTLFLLSSTQIKAQTYNVAVEKVKTVRGLTAVLRNNPADSTCTLMGYTLLVMPINGNPYQIESIGKGSAAADLIYKLPQLGVGDRMQFSNVLIQCDNERAILKPNNLTFILN